MGVDYREDMMCSRMFGEAMVIDSCEHSRESVLEQLRDRLEMQEKDLRAPCMREENVNEDMLWLLRREDRIEKGIYSWNYPQVDMVIVAPPALMALIMGEYELAVQLSKADGIPLWRNRVEELYQDGKKAYIGGGSYTFGEACLMSGEMTIAQKLHFWEKGYYDAEKLAIEKNCLLMDMQFHGGEQTVCEEVWRPLREIRELSRILEDVSGLLTLAVQYLLRIEVDRTCSQFWDILYQMFTSKEEHKIIVDALHTYFINMCSADNLPPRFGERLLDGLRVYFRYEDAIGMNGAVERYVVERIATKTYIKGKRRPHLETYLRIVKKFEGAIDEQWKWGMFALLESQDAEWVWLGIQSNFLRKDCISWYIEYLLQKRLWQEKEHSKDISLIR